MPNELKVIVPQGIFTTTSIFDPITLAVEDCIDIYIQSGVTPQQLPPLLASIYHLETYYGRVCGSGNKFYLSENADHFEANLTHAKLGAKAIGWTFGEKLIENVITWCKVHKSALHTLRETTVHDAALRSFNSSLFGNSLSREEAEPILAELPDDIKEPLLLNLEKHGYEAASEFFLRSFVFLYTSDEVTTVPEGRAADAVSETMEACFPGLAAKTQAARDAKWKALKAENTQATPVKPLSKSILGEFLARFIKPK